MICMWRAVVAQITNGTMMNTEMEQEMIWVVVLAGRRFYVAGPLQV